MSHEAAYVPLIPLLLVLIKSFRKVYLHIAADAVWSDPHTIGGILILTI